MQAPVTPSILVTLAWLEQSAIEVADSSEEEQESQRFAVSYSSTPMGRGSSWSPEEWTTLQVAVAAGKGPAAISACQEWPLSSVKKAPTTTFVRRVRACIRAGGGHFEHTLPSEKDM